MPTIPNGRSPTRHHSAMNSSALWCSFRIAPPPSEPRKLAPIRTRWGPSNVAVTRRACSGWSPRRWRSSRLAVVVASPPRSSTNSSGSQASTRASGPANWRASFCIRWPTVSITIPCNSCGRSCPPPPLPLLDSHRYAERSQARMEGIALSAQGWSKRSISQFLQVSRPTAYSTEFCHPVRRKVATQSTAKLPRNPQESCHPVHGNSATQCTTALPLSERSDAGVVHD